MRKGNEIKPAGESSSLRGRCCLLACTLAMCALPASTAAAAAERYVAPGPDGRLVYETDARGNRILDFSHCGYLGGGVPIPDVPVRVVVPVALGDAGPRIQAAIDYVSRLPADANAFRGTVLLGAGRHEVAGSLRIHTGGVVLRGHGPDANGTVLVAAGNDRRTLIQLAGKNDRQYRPGTVHAVTDRYVPVGARQLRLDSSEGLRAGDDIVIERPSSASWIAVLGMDRTPGELSGGWLSWRPGKMDIAWDRAITAVDGNTITIDAPLTTALEAEFGGGKVRAYTWPGRISHGGVENLRCESAFNRRNPHDDEHAWMAITMESLRDAWVRQVTAVHFASSAVSIWETCKAVTVEDCRSLQPVSENGGYRRHSFYTSGQLTLFQRCRAEQGRHDFAVGYLAAGPNAVVECEAAWALGASGPIESWASGVLYDNVRMDGGGLALDNREIAGQGVGWAAANSVLWQCTAPVITCRKPPTAQNWAIGCWGQFVGDGGWRSSNQSVKPQSLYYGQLADRRGAGVVEQLKRRTVSTVADGARSIDEMGLARESKEAAPLKRMSLSNGWLVCDGQLLTGGRTGTVWWRGHVLPSRAGELGIGLTRFVPGRVGPGYTDDLEQLADSLAASGRVVLDHHWGLWYERRRDDHEMVRRIDGDVWPPFYEQPWARSGQGTAWDGLSWYDLARYNPWYFGRLKQFADLCERKGLVLVQQHYFQHNVLEAGAHWADFPWRPANCLQETGFPEPPSYVNNKRIFMAEAFYDVSHPVRRELHRAYIRKCLDNVASNANVIHMTGEEYTGPLEFVQFWLDTVRDWQAETGKRVLVGLSCTKDVQDAILTDSVRAPLVSVIDMKYWWYAADGSLYAPKGGQNLSPRQHEREWKGTKKRSDAQTARQVRDYRNRFPDKAILCSPGSANGWAVLAAGGSIPNVRHLKDPGLLLALPRMKPFEPGHGLTEGQWALGEPGQNYLVYSALGKGIWLDLSSHRETYVSRWIDPRTNRVTNLAGEIHGAKAMEFPSPTTGPWVLWLSRKLTCD